jgi:hypothetical protein
MSGVPCHLQSSRYLRYRRRYVPADQADVGPILRSYPVADKVQAVTHDEEPVEEEYEETRWRCIICGHADQEDVLLLCDNCNDAYHTHCLDIEGIPEGDWFCPNCINFTGIDFTRNFPAPARHARTAISSSRGRRVARPSRRRQLQQQWDRAWARMRDRAWEALDADVRADEANGEVRGLTERQHEERIRWMNRLSQSSNSGAAYLRATRSESGRSNRGDTPPAAMSDPEEDRAWSMFDAARSSAERAAKRTRRTSSREDTPSSSRNGTPRTPVRSPPTQARKLKRPRTRRVTPPPEIQTDLPADATPARRPSHQPESERRTSLAVGESGTFLQGVLSNINRPKSPSSFDYSTVLTPTARALLFGPSPPHSPPLLARTPTDNFPSLSDILPVSPEPVRQRSSSPSFAVKSHVQTLVSQELKPHYRSGRLTRDEFTEINKKICRKFYEVVDRGEDIEGLVGREVERELDALRDPTAELLVL